MKVVRAELDKARADYDMAVGKARPDDEIARAQGRVRPHSIAAGRRIGRQFANGNDNTRDARRPTQASSRRLAGRQAASRRAGADLQRRSPADEDAARKELADHEQTLDQLHMALVGAGASIGKERARQCPCSTPSAAR